MDAFLKIEIRRRDAETQGKRLKGPNGPQRPPRLCGKSAFHESLKMCIHENSPHPALSAFSASSADKMFSLASHAFFIAASTVSGVIGSRRTLAPVATNTAFATAGAAGGTPGSPIPPRAS